MAGCPLCDRVANRKTDAMKIAESALCCDAWRQPGMAGWCTLILKEHVEHLDELSIECS